ncbi:MAG TPA: hypothetical protein VMV83_03110 [Rectinemataceae bacterium]|nr:hypothetical protein [Rectinemataceae bacterium]
MNLSRLLALDGESIDSTRLSTRRRDFHARLASTTGRPFVALIGPRGVGKTILF